MNSLCANYISLQQQLQRGEGLRGLQREHAGEQGIQSLKLI
jgi:hypothetical protein